MNSSMESLVEMLENVTKLTKDTSFKFELTLLNILQTIELLVVELPSLIASQVILFTVDQSYLLNIKKSLILYIYETKLSSIKISKTNQAN